jgi:hypothetical protein
MKSIVQFWSTKRLGGNGYVIEFPCVDDEQIKRSRHWADYYEACARLKITPNKKEFEKIYCGDTPKDIA